MIGPLATPTSIAGAFRRVSVPPVLHTTINRVCLAPLIPVRITSVGKVVVVALPILRVGARRGRCRTWFRQLERCRRYHRGCKCCLWQCRSCRLLRFMLGCRLLRFMLGCRLLRFMLGQCRRHCCLFRSLMQLLGVGQRLLVRVLGITVCVRWSSSCASSLFVRMSRSRGGVSLLIYWCSLRRGPMREHISTELLWTPPTAFVPPALKLRVI